MVCFSYLGTISEVITTDAILVTGSYLSKGADRQGGRRVAVLVMIRITVHQEVSCGVKEEEERK